MSLHKGMQLALLCAFASAFSPPALSCELDDCSMHDHLHEVLDDTPVPNDRWAWMNHDLATARDAARRGQRAHALTITAELDRAMRAQLNQMVANRGREEVRALHAALQDVTRRASGRALAPLPIGDAIASR